MLFQKKQTYHHLSDEELCQQYLDKHKPQFIGLLFDRYYHLVLGLCLKYLKNETESKDAVLSIFEKLHKDLKTHEPRHFKSWLYMVSKNYCLNLLRKQKSKREKESSYHYYREQGEDEAVNHQMKEAEYENLAEALNELKEPQQSCIRLFFLEQKCYQEIAEHMNLSLKKVKSSIQNGKRNLKIILSKAYENK